ncbi:hypothetical protein AQF52_0411 [Streptomyces venezuelae]|nr:hypothetical protein AQF52_0411 [Streptomyces venezuelae]CUM43763.1 hypothetical protein BN2537_16491 [Streptomyces venezuelae]
MPKPRTDHPAEAGRSPDSAPRPCQREPPRSPPEGHQRHPPQQAAGAALITAPIVQGFLNRRYAAAASHGHRDRVLPGLVRNRPAAPGRGVVRRVRRRRRLGEAVHAPAPNRWRW